MNAKVTLTQEDIVRIATEAAVAAVQAAMGQPALPAKPVRNSKADHLAVNPNVAVQPKADVRYRSAAAKARGSEQAAEIWARHYAAAGVKRFADLTPAQQKAAKTEVAAAWKSIKGTRKTAAK